MPIPEEPLVFSKFGDCIVGPNTPVPKDEQVEKLDYEVELGVVIGKTVPRYTSKEDVPKYIGGFTVVHDVSARYVCTNNAFMEIFVTQFFFFRADIVSSFFSFSVSLEIGNSKRMAASGSWEKLWTVTHPSVP